MNIFVTGICRSGWLLLLYFLVSVCVQAEEVGDSDQIAIDAFWQNLYPAGGWSLYCGYKFAANRKTASGISIGIEHIYPTTWMAKAAGCHNRMQCRESKNLKFMQMEADLHNMYPAVQSLITYRYDYSYGLVNGEDWRFDDCDIEWETGIVEPRQIARGNIARVMLYMHSRYVIPIDKNSLALFKVWNKIDPPSKQEMFRNNIIERIQGNRNPYIDKPSLAEKQNLTMLK